MTLFTPRVFPQIIADMLSYVVANSPITDAAVGSIVRTLLEAAAQEDDEQYFQMLQIVRGYSLDTTTGADLDARGYEYGVVREQPTAASTQVTLGDSAFAKVQTVVYQGLSGPLAGGLAVNGAGATSFPAAGSLIVGRGTAHVETVAYTSITVNVGYVTFNLSTGLAFDHGANETVILSQGGNRVVNAGTAVLVPASDVSPQVTFTLNLAATLLDGENSLTGVLVTAALPGSQGNVPVGAISRFSSPPFATATVTNPSRVTNGTDLETDQAYRDRIKATIQALSRGTGQAILLAVTGLISTTENKRVVSANLVEPTVTPDIVRVYIDDGTGFVPLEADVGVEVVIAVANGGEQFMNVLNVPVAKAYREAANAQPYALFGGETLVVSVGNQQETVTFLSTDFSAPGFATAIEVQARLNTATTFEARVSSGGAQVRVFARTNLNDDLNVAGGTANGILGFPTTRRYSLHLYRLSRNVLSFLTKDGVTAALQSGNPQSYNFGGGFTYTLALVVDGAIWNPLLLYLSASNFVSPAAGLAAEVVAALNAQAVGFLAALTQVNYVLVHSLTLAAANSGLRVLDLIEQAWNTEGGVLVDRTAAFGTIGSNITMFATNGYVVYLGMKATLFSSVWFNLSTPGSSTISPTFQYWNGTAWTTLGVTDTTGGLTATGYLFFQPPLDWAPTTVQGITAYYLRITRNASSLTTPPVESRVKLSSANEVLGFPTTIMVGAPYDYALNRFLGQIQLTQPLLAGDQVTVGSFLTRAFVVAGSAGPYALSGGETVTLSIDGTLVSSSFLAADFAHPGAATASEVATALMSRMFTNITADVVAGGQVRVRTNTFGANGSFQWVSGTATSILGMATTAVNNYTQHVPSLESAGAGPYVFTAGMIVAVIIDNNTGSPYNVPCTFASKLTGVTSVNAFADATLQATFGTAASLVGFNITFTSGVQAGYSGTILTYTPAGGALTTSGFSGTAPSTNDTYFLSPTTNAQVVSFWNNKYVTQLQRAAEIALSSYAAGPINKVQIASLTAGDDAAVQVLDGTGNALLGFPVKTVNGLSGYCYWQGLLQLAQQTIDGVAADPTDFPGVRAAGVQVEIIEPVVVKVIVQVTITPQAGVTTTSIANEITSAISAYVNGLGVGDSVLVAELSAAILAVVGVQDLALVTPTVNVLVASNALARVSEGNITVS